MERESEIEGGREREREDGTKNIKSYVQRKERIKR